MLIRRLKIITLPGFRDMLRTAVTEEEANMALFNPIDVDYELKGNDLYYRGSALTKDEVISQLANPLVNKPLKEPVLIYAVWTFLTSSQFDLRNNIQFETTVNDFSKYFGISTGEKGFNLLEKLESYKTVYGVIPDRGVFPLLEIEHQEGKLILKSSYLHLAYNMILDESLDEEGIRRKLYDTDKVHADLLTERNKIAAMIVIELVRLVVTAGRNGHPHISLRELARCIPHLNAIWLSEYNNGYKNRQLRRAFNGVEELLKKKTELYTDYLELKLNIPRLKVSSPKEVVRIEHEGLRLAKKWRG